MKIVFIGPLPQPVTGHSLACKILLDELIKYHQVEVINLNKGDLKQGGNSIRRMFQVGSILIDVWRKKKRADVIYLTISESLWGNIKDLFIYLICYRSLARMVIHLHGGSIRKLLFDQNSLVFWINKHIIRRLGGAIVLGDSHVDIFADIIDRHKIHIVPNFAEDYLFITEEEVKSKFNNSDPLRVLFLSNLIEGKGYNELVDAFQGLDDKFRERVVIEFAGEFESEIRKREFLRKIGPIGRIHYRGALYGAEKRSILSRAHIFCLPTSLNEGQPISILEAYASGCVVVTTNQGGIGDVFRNMVNGFEVEKTSHGSIRLVIEKILRGDVDLLPIAITNRKIAYEKFRTSSYKSSLMKIIERIGSHSTKYA